ncbi:recombinase family protein [Alistipes sp. OttesenSCG-928-B03]|nr:recombinase family protein [Alistipes sp. OttesenSCG-928-B03]
MNTVIYARVSTTNGAQDYQRQINDLTTVAETKGWAVEAVFAERLSGAKRNEERPAFMEMVEFVQTHDINKVLITELSRFGRDTLQVLTALEILNQAGISVYIQNYGIETLTPSGTPNPMSQFLVTLLAEVARWERKTIRERVESGYRNHLASGGRVGRRPGYQKSAEQMREQYAKEIQLLRKDYSLRNIQAITGTSVNTLRKIKTII